jgi:mannose-6-phosphate isomerase-like protein (cupin superfamily)
MSIRVDKLWGSEEIVHNGEDYCCKILRISAGRESSLHYHRVKRETFYVLEGVVLLFLQSRGRFLKLMRGSHVTIEPGDPHSFQSGDSEKLCIVLESSSHHLDSDVVRVRPSRVLDR